MTPPPDPPLTGPTQATDRQAVAAVLAALDLVTVADQPDVFVGTSLPQPGGRVFGGQVLAQALLAAARTVTDDRLPHSMHAYFMRPGDSQVPIGLGVERLRDGRSFSVRRVTAVQHDQPLLSATMSFQVDQPGLDNHEPMPGPRDDTLVPSPDEVPTAADVLARIDHPVARYWSQETAFDVRHVGGALYLTGQPSATGRQLVWMKSRTPLPDDPVLHRALMAFACDQVMLEPSMRRSGLGWSQPGLSVASLDHAMWWHRPARVDEWLLYAQSSPSAQGGRGLGKARVFTADGTMVASIAQEGMIRVPLD
ncbi:MAG: acyl-CoA thioesterase II [Micrococcales bacterium]|nr:acyl-CoA thioesterase II [Micrococcales bacterium]